MAMNRRTLVLGTGAALAALTLTAPVITYADDWVLLGSQSVAFVQSRAVIPVTFLRGSFTHIQLRVSDNAIYINDLVVNFTLGQASTLPVRNRIAAGTRTREIDLPGNRRLIRSVELLYRSEPSRAGRARVEVWGRR